jgi:hypothetical protein
MTAFFWHDPRPRPTAGVPRGKGLGWPLGCDEMGAEPTTVRARRVMPRVHCTRAQAIPRACAGREGHGGKRPVALPNIPLHDFAAKTAGVHSPIRRPLAVGASPREAPLLP